MANEVSLEKLMEQAKNLSAADQAALAAIVNGAAQGRKCELTPEQFMAAAKDIILTSKDGKVSVVLSPKQFAKRDKNGKVIEGEHGSFGWAFAGKLGLPINGELVTCQGSLNCPVSGSKPTE